MSYNIAIDGPAGAGKSTIAKLVSKKLNYIYIDTGAMYRTMALYMLRNSIDIHNEELVSNECKNVDIRLENTSQGQMIFLDGENVSETIRNEEVGIAASVTSAYPRLRNILTDMQKDMASRSDVVMDGRDIGTVVLPNANLKIYLTASVQARALRRYKELTEKGESCDLEAIKKDIELRDYQDMNRETAPLKQADDAILIDSSDLTIQQVVDSILSLARK